MDRLERLVNLVAALLATGRPLTADEIGERVAGFSEPGTASFRRSFERDKATLRAMGIPIETLELEPSNPESAVGYRIRRRGYELTDPGLEPDEVAALHLAATHVRMEGSAPSGAIWKLGGAPSLPAGEVLERAATAELPGSEHLPVLFEAVATRAPVTFPYQGVARTVDPWRLEFRNGAWYLVGRDHARDDRRTFRVDRFDGQATLGDAGTFERPAGEGRGATHPWEMGEEDPVDVTVLIDADQADWAIANAGDAAAVVRGDGSATISLRVTNRGGLRTWVLGFLDHAEIVDPPEERAAMVAWLEAIA